MYIGGIGQICDGDKHTYGSRPIKSFGFFPGKTFFFQFLLDITCSKINTNGDFIIIAVSKLLIDIFTCAANFYYKFRFVMNILREVRNKKMADF